MVLEMIEVLLRPKKKKKVLPKLLCEIRSGHKINIVISSMLT